MVKKQICNIIYLMNLLDTHKTLQIKVVYYTFFSRAYRTFTKIDITQ